MRIDRSRYRKMESYGMFPFHLSLTSLLLPPISFISSFLPHASHFGRLTSFISSCTPCHPRLFSKPGNCCSQRENVYQHFRFTPKTARQVLFWGAIIPLGMGYVAWKTDVSILPLSPGGETFSFSPPTPFSDKPSSDTKRY